MKKIDTSNIVAGIRKLGLVKASFDHLQEAYKDVLNDVLQGILAQASGYTSLFGCVNSGSGSVYTISAGAIYGSSQQEVFEIAAFSGTAPGGNVPVLSLVTTYRSGDPVIYSDASSINTHAIVKLQWTFGVSGSGLCDFSALQTLKNRINSSLLDVPGQISTAVANLVNSSPSTLDTLKELADALGDDPNFATTMATSLAAITTALAGKVAKAGDTMTGALVVNSTIDPQGGIKTPSGRILKKEFIDIVNWNMGSSSSIIVSLPVSYKKIRTLQVVVRDDSDSIYYNLFGEGSSGTPGTPQGGAEISNAIVPANTVTLFRAAGGFFTSGLFNAVGGFVRGWVTIEYEP